MVKIVIRSNLTTFVDVLATCLDQETVELLSFVGDWNGHTLILAMTNQELLVNWLSVTTLGQGCHLLIRHQP